MFFGGTNFGFTAGEFDANTLARSPQRSDSNTGANDFGYAKYRADITSYDYDAVMDEAGDPNGMKYVLVKDVLEKHFKLPSGVVPAAKPKMSLRPVRLDAVGDLLSAEGCRYLGSAPQRHASPITFEKLGQNSGFVLYETELPSKAKVDPTLLTVNELRDRALVFIDRSLVGVLSRENAIKSLPLHSAAGRRLKILVENQGRINFNVFNDFKVRRRGLLHHRRTLTLFRLF